MIWCVIDDLKFEQGSALNAVALAGSWKLSNLCVIYDGTYDTMSENLEVDNFKTHGWNVLELMSDESLNIIALCTALNDSRRSNAPTLVSMQLPNRSLSHEVDSHLNNNAPLYLPQELYDTFLDVSKKSNIYKAEWLARVKKYRELYPALAREFWYHVAGRAATITHHQPALTSPIPLPISSLPVEQWSRRRERRSSRRDDFSQQPDRRSRPGRTKPETFHIRPCDAEEAAGAFLVSTRSTKITTTISLPLKGDISFPGHSSRLGVTNGAYTFSKCHDEDFDLTLISAGVGIHYAMGTQEFLIRKYGLKARIVSCPCLRLFQLQTEEYRKSILRPQSRKPTVAIDFGNSQEWKAYADALMMLENGANADIEVNMLNRIGSRVKDFVQEHGHVRTRAREIHRCPTINWLVATTYEAWAFGYAHKTAEKAGYKRELDAAVAGLRVMHRRGIVVLPGVDYGFAWTAHGTNARDLDKFVKLLGPTSHESIIAATAGIATLMMRGHELGKIQPGYYADCILVGGDPLQDISILQDQDKLDVTIINCRVHKAGGRSTLWTHQDHFGMGCHVI
ncbi:related to TRANSKETOLASE [Fusarium mangiferae]|uniref:Related to TRANSKETOLASE n=1 Tax=Fusarium mangiferae TaxID=192010 RepID=A0A1L7U7H8_FUSMA|nr:uncharacterized protein FMAN_15182 [Fusarium mangiferae]CVL03461.1 related to TRANSKETOLASE [Fusarium mangiferae]